MSIKKNKKNTHYFFLNLALQQAKKNLGNTKNNPSVGCIIVKNNCVLGLGSTAVNGRPHAEYQAIKSSKNSIKNSDFYVTLEPCVHYGKTPPCVKNIIKNQVKRVFFSTFDPDKRTFKKSLSILKKKKIEVNPRINAVNSDLFYRSYIKFKRDSLPFVTGKLAISKDYFTKSKKDNFITNELSRFRGHMLRSYHDCIIAGINTVNDDNPILNCRIQGLKNQSPTRVILDKDLKIHKKSNIVKTAKIYSTIVFFNTTNPKKIRELKKQKIKLVKTELSKDGSLNLFKILYHLKSLGFSRIFVESGIRLITSFFNNNLFDDFFLFSSNKRLGNNGDYSFKSAMRKFLKNKKGYSQKVNLNGEKLIFYKVK